MKAGTTADGLDQIEMAYLELATGTQYNLVDATALGVGKANKIYICNESTDETYFADIMIDGMMIGALYAGDWMFLPWDANDAVADIEIRAYTGTNKIAYAVFHEGKTLMAVD
tara:strand:+ start:355 stop:693 length:339 start_codon:yes stop_codon:yes gene_type:complete